MKKSGKCKFPSLDKEQYAVIRVNEKYGQILKINGEIYSEDGEIYLIFPDYKSALHYVEEEKEKHRDLFFIIFDSNKKQVDAIISSGKEYPDTRIDHSKMTSVKIDKRTWLKKLLKL